ncbi:MAG: serine hydrolase [Oscillospiraceae bacterium]|nr:serine hydrolase [Oscillospiraceae bacterium]
MTDLASYVREKEPNICQIAVLRDGEEIFRGEWNGYRSTDCTHIMSATKSIVSLLVGIAIDKGMIKGTDEKVLSFFPDYKVKRGEKTIYDVTIEHLLTMRAPYKGKGDPWTKVCSSENWTEASLDFLGGRKGITGEFDYRTVCLHILSGILYRVTGQNTVDFANKYLFGPIGVAEHRNYYAMSAEEHRDFTISKQPKENVWFADPQGLGTAGYGLCMSAVDMAKIGQLCLNGGTWNGQRIISEEWIRRMTDPRDVLTGHFRGMQYGYLWWIVHPDMNIYAAIGNSGNVIYVDPERNTVAAVTSFFRPTVFDRVDFIEDVLLPEM